MRRFLTDGQNRKAAGEHAKLSKYVSDGRFVGTTARDTVLSLGFERESCLITESGDPAMCGNTIVDEIGASWMKREFPRCVVEVNSDTIAAGPAMFDELHRQLIERRGIVAAHAREHGAYVLDCGLLGSYPEAALNDGADVVSDALRYRSLLRYLGTRNGRYEIAVNGVERGLKVAVPVSPVPAGLTGGGSPNVGFHPSVIGLAADLSTATAWAFPRLCSSSPFAFGRRALWCNRVPVWQYGMDPERRLSPFGIGRYWGVRGAAVILEWANFVREGELVLDFDEAGVDPESGAFPLLNLLTGTRWVQAGRLRQTVVGDELAVYFEHRVMDTAFTIMDDVANAAVFVGLISALIAADTDPEDLSSYAHAERNFERCVRTRDAEIMWRGRMRMATDVVREEILPLAIRGLQSLGFDQCFAESLIGVVSRRIENGRTAAEWLLERADHLSSVRRVSEDEAVRLALREAALMQTKQCGSLSCMQGVADW